MKDFSHSYIFENFVISDLSYDFILKHSYGFIEPDRRNLSDIQPQNLEINYGEFIDYSSNFVKINLCAKLEDETFTLSCDCGFTKKKLCSYQAKLLSALISAPELRIFFDRKLRFEKIKTFAKDYGLENERNPDEFFEIEYYNKSFRIRPISKELLAVTDEKNKYLEEQLLPDQNIRLPENITDNENTKKIIVLKTHKYYKHFQVDFLECGTTLEGKIKNPLRSLNPFDFIWQTNNTEEIKFYTAISKFKNSVETEKKESDLEGLKALVKNPFNLDFYYHDNKVSENVTINSLNPVTIKVLDVDLSLQVNSKENFYEIYANLFIEDKPYELKTLNLKYNFFLSHNDNLYFIDNLNFLKVIEFFKKTNNKIIIHISKFEEFRQNILSRLENKIKISYSYLKQATKKQLEENNFDKPDELIIYLSDLENYVLLTPVIKYGNIEVPVLSRKKIYSTDALGNVFTVDRNRDLELSFISNLVKQHPDFKEQLYDESFYLHKKYFLDVEWFLETFEKWQEQNITILGFNEIKKNNLNPNKAKVKINVQSGIDWFETTLIVMFGKHKATLGQLHKAVKNKSKFVKLDDGTLGILPAEWLEKFSSYFSTGEVIEEKIRTAKTNFSIISQLYKKEVLSENVKMELEVYNSKISNFENIKDIKIPEGLKTTLRDYQKQGLNWLNFLDEFNFGGCLADDMGLGKTIQIIAFILSQREKVKNNTNLIVVPSMLIYNWQSEIEKFAPSIKIHTIYGSDRVTNTKDFSKYEVILTSYGTLMSDIDILKKYSFNYIFLDESQNIKNPESQRYQAVMLLKSRNKIVLSGTPIENNTFDLYGQLSFACPGLLGSKQSFKELYSIPIDKFHDNERAIELQKKINPFVLRRTKRQVEKELPDKTEITVYCEMGSEQRKVYDTYKKEYQAFLLLNQNIGTDSKYKMHVLKGLTTLRQICDSPAIVKSESFYGESSAKIDVLMDEIESKHSQHKILVFSQFVTMLDLIKEKLSDKNIPFTYLTGQSKKRNDEVDQFKNDENIRVFLISLKAGGTGLNLTEADYVYLVDPWWNPAIENQAIDRCYRIGQKKNIVAVRLICPDTIEEKIMKLQESKKELVSDLIKTDSSILKSLSKDDLINLFN